MNPFYVKIMVAISAAGVFFSSSFVTVPEARSALLALGGVLLGWIGVPRPGDTALPKEAQK